MITNKKGIYTRCWLCCSAYHDCYIKELGLYTWNCNSENKNIANDSENYTRDSRCRQGNRPAIPITQQARRIQGEVFFSQVQGSLRKKGKTNLSVSLGETQPITRQVSTSVPFPSQTRLPLTLLVHLARQSRTQPSLCGTQKEPHNPTKSFAVRAGNKGPGQLSD